MCNEAVNKNKQKKTVSGVHYDHLFSSNPEPDGHVKRGVVRGNVTTALNAASLDISWEAVELKKKNSEGKISIVDVSGQSVGCKSPANHEQMNESWDTQTTLKESSYRLEGGGPHLPTSSLTAVTSYWQEVQGKLLPWWCQDSSIMGHWITSLPHQWHLQEAVHP